MSIINEALKKASKEVKGAETWKLNVLAKQETVLNHPGTQQVSVKSSGISWKTVFIALFLCLCAVVIAATWYDVKNMEREKTAVMVPAKGVDEPVKIELPQAKPKKHVPPKKIKIPDLKLSGIMMEYPPSALVNGQFVSVNDEVEGVTVLEIHKDYVVFEFRGQKFKRSIY